MVNEMFWFGFGIGACVMWVILETIHTLEDAYNNRKVWRVKR